MRIPDLPPPFEELLRRFRSADVPELFQHAFSGGDGAAPGNRYRHWATLRHLTPPNGLSPEAWWFAIKVTRSSQLKALPLKDALGHPFRYMLPDPALELLHDIDRNASGHIAMAEPVTNAATKEYYLVNSLIEEAITSSQLEGASTTRKVAKEMLRSGRPPRDRSEQMILNNFVAMNHIRDRLEDKLTPDFVFELHRMLTDKTLDQADGGGRFRRAEDEVVMTNSDGEVLHTPPPAEMLPARLRDMCAFANGDSPREFVHPLVRSILLHLWLAYDHPFVDGNGRTARALFYWSMLKQGYWLAEYLSISRILRKAPTRYGRSFLYTETDDNDATYFLLAQMSVIKLAIADLFAYLRRKMAELQATQALLRKRGTTALNARQLALLSHALKHADYPYTIEGHANSHHVVYETARTDLLGLVKLGLLVKQKVGKAYNFFAVPRLEEKLHRL